MSKVMTRSMNRAEDEERCGGSIYPDLLQAIGKRVKQICERHTTNEGQQHLAQ